MAKDTEVGITLKTSFREASTEINSTTRAFEALANAMNLVDDMQLKRIDLFTRYIKRMDDVSLSKINANLKRTAEYVTDFVTRFQTNEMKIVNDRLIQLANNLSDVFKMMDKVSKVKGIDLSSLSSISNLSYDKINTDKLVELTNIFQSMHNARIDQVSNAIERLVRGFSSLEKLNFNPTMENNINSNLTKMAKSLGVFMNALEGIDVSGFVKISKAITTVPNAMKAISALDASTIGEKFETISTKIRDFIATLKEGDGVIHDFATVLTKIGGTGSTKVNSSDISKTLNRVKEDIKETGNEADRTRRKFNNMFTFGKMYAFYNQLRHYGSSFLQMLNKSIDFAEIENYFSRAMGRMRSEAMEFQKTLSNMYGLAEPAMMKAQATFRNMLGALGGLEEETSYALSERLMKMVLDYSSLYNTTIDSAITKFEAALSRQVRPIRSQSGYDITQKVLESTMNMIGIYDRAITQMGEMEKRLLIILTLQYQMARSSAMNDLARTIKFSGFTLRSVLKNLVNACKSGVVTNCYC